MASSLMELTPGSCHWGDIARKAALVLVLMLARVQATFIAGWPAAAKAASNCCWRVRMACTA